MSCDPGRSGRKGGKDGKEGQMVEEVEEEPYEDTHNRKLKIVNELLICTSRVF